MQRLKTYILTVCSKAKGLYHIIYSLFYTALTWIPWNGRYSSFTHQLLFCYWLLMLLNCFLGHSDTGSQIETFSWAHRRRENLQIDKMRHEREKERQHRLKQARSFLGSWGLDLLRVVKKTSLSLSLCIHKCIYIMYIYIFNLFTLIMCIHLVICICFMHLYILLSLCFLFFSHYPPGNYHISPPSRHFWIDDFPFPLWWDMWSFPGGYKVGLASFLCFFSTFLTHLVTCQSFASLREAAGKSKVSWLNWGLVVTSNI